MTELRRYFGGTSVEQAVLAAARHYQIEPGEVAWRLLEKRHGFLKARHKVMIEVDPAAPRREAPPPAPPKAAAAPPPAVPRPASRPVELPAPRPASTEPARIPVARRELPPPVGGPDADALREAAGLLATLAGLEVEASVHEGAGPDELLVDLHGAEEHELTRGHGELLHAIDHLAPRIARGLGAGTVLARVDSGGFQESESDRLRSMALAAADEVRRSGEERLLPWMPPAERRVIHLALADDPDVATHSDGDGFRKRVAIRPRREA